MFRSEMSNGWTGLTIKSITKKRLNELQKDLTDELGDKGVRPSYSDVIDHLMEFYESKGRT